MFVNLAKDNTTRAGIKYKELYDCKWDPMTLYTAVFKFL